LDKSVLYGVAAVAQGQVVFSGAALVAVPFKRELNVGMLAEELRLPDGRLLVWTNTIGVVVEVDVAYMLRTILLRLPRAKEAVPQVYSQ
jgi:hypothetical protein